MADTLTTTTTVSTIPSGSVIATDDVGGAHYQRVKLALGADGTASDAPVGGGVESGVLRVTIANDSTGLVSVDDNGGSLTVDGTVTANAGTGTRTVTGDVAHGTTDSGSPVKIGGKGRTTNPTAEADGDRVDATFDDLGRQVVVLNQFRDLVASQLTTISNTTETTIVTAVASTFHDLTHLTITNATATAVVVTLRDATAGSAVGTYALAANGGIVLAYPVPKKQTTVNTAWTLQLSAGSITVYVVADYVKNI